MQYQLDFAIDTLTHAEITQYLDKAKAIYNKNDRTEELRETLRKLVEAGKVDVTY